ncbi:MAG TPA: hypothetical protein VFV22_02145 [Candidatus Paceibacterota bacterium]|nr:hypothetical protein [Candidatus Paceibacterota bacterium]
MNKFGYILPIFGSFLIFVSTASAQIRPGYFDNSASYIIDFIQGRLIPLLFGVAIVVFIWGMIKTFLLGSDSDDKREEGKKLMLWGIMAFVFMTALWGIVALVTNFFGIGNQTGPGSVPLIPRPTGSN